ELEQLLNRLPHAVLFRFQDESFPRSFRTKNPQFFSWNDWIDLDDLKAWLGQQEDLKHFLNEPTILDSWQLPNDPLGFVQSQSNYHDLFDNRFDIYGTAGLSQSSSAISYLLSPFVWYAQHGLSRPVPRPTIFFHHGPPTCSEIPHPTKNHLYCICPCIQVVKCGSTSGLCGKFGTALGTLYAACI
ncbi:hypothetical protein B0H14DRAFT_2699217, partial [Mycena olivaceomarginata]